MKNKILDDYRIHLMTRKNLEKQKKFEELEKWNLERLKKLDEARSKSKVNEFIKNGLTKNKLTR